MNRQNIAFDQLSNNTPWQGNMNASYEEAFRDPMAQDLPDEAAFGKDPRFNDNLVRYIREDRLGSIGNNLTDFINKDIGDRENWVKIITEAIDYLGIGGQKLRTSRATRNTDVYSTTLMTIALKVTAKLHCAFFPANGFVDTTILGKETDEKIDKAERIKQFFNYYIRDVAKEYIPDKKQAFWWMVLEGSVFSKVYYDKYKRRPVAPYIRAGDMIIDSGATSLDDAERITWEFVISEREYLERVALGEFIKAPLEPCDPYDNRIKQKTDSKIGVQSLPDDQLKLYCLHECICYLDIPGFEHLDEHGKPDGKPLPYIVTKDKNSNNIISVYRNWNEEDPDFTSKKLYVQHKYFSGFNIYGLGLFHLLLGSSKAETEIQQQLLKASQLANAPILLMAPGIRSEKTQLDITAGSVNQFQSFGTDFNNNTKELGFRDPSGVPLQLKQMLRTDAQELSAARDIDPTEIPSNMPATTMLGILSTRHHLEDSLMNDLYISFKEEFSLLFELFGKWLPDQPYPFDVDGGENVIMRQDFQPSIAIRPTVDPNVSNSTLQLIINEAISGLAQQSPDLYDMKAIHKRMLKSMKISNPDELFKQEEPPPPPPPARDPITEGKVAMLGQAIKAYKWQDQDSYIAIHQNNVAQLEAEQNPDHAQAISILKGNIQERQAMKYVADMEAKLGYSLADVSPPQGQEGPEGQGQPQGDDPQIPEVIQNQIAMQVARKLQEEQKEEAEKNPPPQDPSIVLAEEVRVKEKGIDMQARQNESKVAVEQAKIQEELQIQKMKIELEMEKINLEREKMNQEYEIKMASIRNSQIESEAKRQDEQFQKMQELALDKEKSDLQVQSKAYDSTLRYEKDLQQKESGHGFINDET